MTETFIDLFTKPVARAVYSCGCEVHYTAGGYSVRNCIDHSGHQGYPRVRKLEFLENGAREGEFTIWRPVQIVPARRSTDSALK